MGIDWENYGRERYSRPARQSSAYRTQTYVDGNTVRKAEAMPKRNVPEYGAEPARRQRPQRKPAPKHYPQRQPVRMPGISGRGFLFLSAMLSMVIITCFSYLSLQSDVRTVKAQVVSLQSQIVRQREENEEMYQAIADTVDLAKIYRRATRKLGMVEAQNNQVFTYKSRKSDLVKQYAEIPG